MGGVNITDKLLQSAAEMLLDIEEFAKKERDARTVSLVTGVASYPMMMGLKEKLAVLCPEITLNVYKIVNNFFGESITVSGLLTGKDICEQLLDKSLGDELLIPENALRHGEDVFLCGMTVGELSEKLGVAVTPSGSDGYGLVEAILGDVI